MPTLPSGWIALTMRQRSRRGNRRYSRPSSERTPEPTGFPSTCVCAVCRTTVQLHDVFANTCPKCGTEYNGMGQRLAPRNQWGEETGETLADIFSPHDPEEIKSNDERSIR